MIAEHKTFYNVGSIERIPLGEGRTYRVEEADIAVFRTRSWGVYATQAAYSHKGDRWPMGLWDRALSSVHSTASNSI